MKAAGNYRSLIRGVSEQAPELRPDGQVTEQVNMIPDPVQGLSRRFGSQFQAEQLLDTDEGSTFEGLRADTANYRTFDYFSQGSDYTILLRRAERPADSQLPVCIVYNRTAKEFLTVTRNVVDADLDLLESGGASAVTNVGKYVFMAGNTVVPTASTTELWSDTANLSKAVVWIRGGAFARTYSVKATKLDNSTVEFEYTTPQASYPGLLDTTGVPVFIPDTSGSTTASLPTQTGFSEQLLTGLVGGGTTTLTHSPSGILVLSYTNGQAGEGYDVGQFFEGVHYTISGAVITWLPASYGPDEPASGIDYIAGLGLQVFATYQYLAGGSSSQTVYATETSTEALYIRLDNGAGIAKLVYGDWAPTTLSVKQVVTPLTNVSPAVPANVNEYAWAAGSGVVVFHKDLVNNPFITATYTHTKVLANPNYAKQVNDVTNVYNTAVTKWIGTAAEAIQPQNIAEQLRLAAVAAGLASPTRDGSTIIFTDVKSLAVNDGGDGSLIRGVADEVASVDDVSTVHSVGKVVKVRGKNSKESFYLVATAKDRTVTSGYTEVIWVEGAGTAFQVTTGLIYGQAIGSTFYMASTAALLDVLTSETAPTYDVSEAGDADTNPLPYFIGRKITMLGVFQDRLLVGCGGVIRASKTAEYLNFFRSTVLSLPADDAVEFLSQGSADDELRYSMLYDQNLVIFGLKRQYIINGKQPLTPTNANMVPMSNHADAAELPPLAAAGFIFYGKKGPASSSVHQIQPGLNTNSPDSFIISSQIDLYLNGDAIELAQIAKPSTLFLRTAGSRNSVYCFSYLDTQDGRKQDAWHRWDYSDLLGDVIGIQPTPEGLIVFTLRSGTGGYYAVADMQVMTTGLSTYPYLDSVRDYEASPTGSWATPPEGLFAAFDTSTEFQFLGDNLEQVDALIATFPDGEGLRYGAPYEAQITPTNPFTRDDAGHAIIDGRLTVAKFTLKFTRSSGYVYDVVTDQGTETIEFNGREFGDVNNLIGREPISSYDRTLPIGKETRDFTVTIKSREWFPFTITSVSWTGQYFNRTQRP